MEYHWIDFRKYYARKFGTTEQMVDLIASYETIRLCVTGYSNRRISNRLLISVIDVEETIFEFLDFLGWDYDLDFSPIALYNKSNGIFMAYEQEISMVTGRLSDYSLVVRSFDICRKFLKIKERIDSFYGTKS